MRAHAISKAIALQSQPAGSRLRLSKGDSLQMPAHPFSDLRIAITGGTSGLGLALVHLLHEHGARVAFVARDPRAGRRGRPRSSGHTRHRGRRRVERRHLSDGAADSRRAGRSRRPGQQRVGSRPDSAGAARRHRVRGSRARARDKSSSARFASQRRCSAHSRHPRAKDAGPSS